VPGRGIGELEHGHPTHLAPFAHGGRARDDGRPEAQPDEPHHRVGRRQLERDAACHPGPGERGVDLLPQPGLGPHLDERQPARQLGEVGPCVRFAGYDRDEGFVGEDPVGEVGGDLVGEEPDERQIQVARAHLLVVGLAASTVAAAVLLVAVLTGSSLVAVLAPLFVVVATRGLVSSNATVLGVQQAPAVGSASAILGALMFAGGVLVTPLMALGGEGTALPMVAVVAGGASAALLATALLTLRR